MNLCIAQAPGRSPNLPAEGNPIQKQLVRDELNPAIE